MFLHENPAKNANKIFPLGSNPIEILNLKWGIVPAGNSNRINTLQMLKLSTRELVDLYEKSINQDTLGSGFGIRGWFHEIYKGLMADKAVLGIGSGFGISSIFFAREGVDFVSQNLHKFSFVSLLNALCSLLIRTFSLGFLDCVHC